MIKIRIVKDYLSACADIYIYDESHDGKISIAKPIDLQFGTLEQKYSMPEPTLKLERGISNDFLKALSNALNEIDVKPESDSIVKGKLEATLSHLEDMRSLVFGKKNK